MALAIIVVDNMSVPWVICKTTYIACLSYSKVGGV